MQGSLRWVVAFPTEALPIIREFGLKEKSNGAGPFPFYQSSEGEVSLVISGKGILNSAAATAALAASVDDAPAAWINFGIAGSGNPDYGKTFLGSRISDEQSKRCWYPSPCGKAKVEPERRPLKTVGEPALQYPESGTLVEMEAAGFYPIALKCSTSELCQVVKVVSDDPDHPIASLNKEVLVELCEAGLQAILPWLESIRNIVSEEREVGQKPEEYFDILEKFHFTETQKHQLSKLLRFWNAKENGRQPVGELLEDCRDSREVISAIRGELYQVTL